MGSMVILRAPLTLSHSATHRSLPPPPPGYLPIIVTSAALLCSDLYSPLVILDGYARLFAVVSVLEWVALYLYH